METKQTITVTIPAVMQNNRLSFAIDGKEIAEITPHFYNKSKYSGQFLIFKSCNNKNLPDAVEFISNCIEDFFKRLNINVKFETI